MYGTEGWSSPVTLGEVLEQVRKSRAHKWDARAHWVDLSFQPGRKGVQMAVRGIDRTLSMTPHAFANVCGRLGIPSNYAAGLHPAMAAELMRYEYVRRRLAQSSKGLLIRCYGDLVRGLVSDRYVPLDDISAIEAVHEELAGTAVLVHHFHAGPELTELRLVFPDRCVQLKRTRRVGDIVGLGLYLRNSEVGESSLAVHVFVLRLVCTNGLIAAHRAFYAWRHTAIRPERALAELRRAIRRAHDLLPEVAELLDQAAETGLRYGAQQALVTLARDQGFSDSLTNRVLQAYAADPHDSLFGVVNALTAVARWSRARTRTRLEVLAGDIIREPRLYGLETT